MWARNAGPFRTSRVSCMVVVLEIGGRRVEARRK